MRLNICAVYEDREFLKPNDKGCETIEIEINQVDGFTINDKVLRTLYIDKCIYRLTLKSFKALKKEIYKKGLLYRFNALEKR